VDILSNPIWQLALGLFSAISTIPTISTIAFGIIALRQRRRKEVSWQIVTNTPIIRVNSDTHRQAPALFGDFLHITFHDQPVNSVWLVILKIWNSGNVEIEATDYAKPITFSFGSAKVLNVTFMEAPEGINTDMSGTWHAFTFEPGLLNRRDCITFGVLLGDHVEDEDIKLPFRSLD